MGICIVRLVYPCRLATMRLPPAAASFFQKTALYYFGYGSRRREKPYEMTDLNTAPKVPLVDISHCINSTRYESIGAAMKNEFCIKAENMSVMSLYDNGGGLIHVESRTIVGVGVTYYGDYGKELTKEHQFQLFINILPLRLQILKAMEDLDEEF